MALRNAILLFGAIPLLVYLRRAAHRRLLAELDRVRDGQRDA